MCGIGGWVDFGSRSVSEMKAVGKTMISEMKHRGPDGFGLETFSGDLGTVAMLMHRRLSILGLGDSGKQPMCSQNGRFWITFNGEIYNYLELASEFGLSINSGTDTEVLLALWCLKGPDAISLLDGFFAFAIWDTERLELTLVRDKTGVKPLYYYLETETGDAAGPVKSLYFGSEDFALKQALSECGIEVSLNAMALIAHMEEGASDRGVYFSGMHELDLGGYLTFSSGRQDADVNSSRGVLEVGVWRSENPLRLDDAKAWQQKLGLKEETKNHWELLRAQLMGGMRKRLRSDVPIGFAVSGGVDSAALVGMARALLGKEAHLHIFSVVAPGMDGDESEYQKSVVEHVGGIWHTVDVRKLEGKYLEKYIKATHRPPVAWNNLAHFALCESVRAAGVKVLFNGQGADELFGGYPHYYKAAFWEEKTTLWPVRKKWPLGFRAAGFQWGKSVIGSWMGRSFETCVDVLMRRDYYGERLTQLLRFEDRNGMACGIESRNPFADDYRLADAWLNLWVDEEWSLEGALSARVVDGFSKGYLRKAMGSGLAPDDVLWRVDKKGFSVPRNELTARGLVVWEAWILSDRLDGLVARGRRVLALEKGLKALAREHKNPSNGQPLQTIKLKRSEEKLFDQLFRWAAMGCYLELFPSAIQGSGSQML